MMTQGFDFPVSTSYAGMLSTLTLVLVGCVFAGYCENHILFFILLHAVNKFYNKLLNHLKLR